jgi:hypothetical protein
MIHVGVSRNISILLAQGIVQQNNKQVLTQKHVKNVGTERCINIHTSACFVRNRSKVLNEAEPLLVCLAAEAAGETEIGKLLPELAFPRLGRFTENTLPGRESIF